MRRAECVGMTVDDIDLDQRMVWVLGKGHRPRALPLGRKTAQALDRYLRVREEHRLAYLPNLWVGRNGPMTPSGVYHVVHDRARAAGLPAMHPHQLRRAFATSWLVEGGKTWSAVRAASAGSERITGGRHWFGRPTVSASGEHIPESKMP
jgi:site-specific recombinase XerD